MSKTSKLKLKAIRRRQARKTGGSVRVASKLTRRQSEALVEASELMDEGEFEEAEEILLELNRKVTFPAIIGLLASLYSETKRYASAADQTSRLVRLLPNDPVVRLQHGNSAMYASYATIALVEFQEFLRRWPEHESANQVRDLILILAEEAEQRIAKAQFPLGSEGIRLQVLHEEALLAVNNQRFEDVIRNCEQLLGIAPEFCSARNNLALGHFHSGKHSTAIDIAETTTQLFPGNRFGAILLAKLKLLAGDLEPPEDLIAELLDNPPDNQDTVAAAAEWLAMLGRDEDLVRFLQVLPPSVLVDPVLQALCLHYEAYGRCRLGQTKQARKLWEKSVKLLPHGTTAQENLDELRNPVENANWPCSLESWVPRSSVKQLLDLQQTTLTKNRAAYTMPSYFKNLLPIFLDRGDPALRRLAVAMYLLEGSTESLELVKQFGLSSCGSDAIRHEALMSLHQKGFVNKGPHKFFSNGQATEFKLVDIEIFSEPKPSALSQKLRSRLKQAHEAMHQHNLDLAERIFEEVLTEVPECESRSVQYNLATVWMTRDGKAGRKRAQAVFEAIHQRDPDYLFAGIGLAQLHSLNGEHDKAVEILNRYNELERLHISEAKGLYVAQAQVAKQQGNQEQALSMIEVLERLLGDNDPEVIALRELIESTGWARILRLFKRL